MTKARRPRRAPGRPAQRRAPADARRRRAATARGLRRCRRVPRPVRAHRRRASYRSIRSQRRRREPSGRSARTSAARPRRPPLRRPAGRSTQRSASRPPPRRRSRPRPGRRALGPRDQSTPTRPLHPTGPSTSPPRRARARHRTRTRCSAPDQSSSATRRAGRPTPQDDGEEQQGRRQPPHPRPAVLSLNDERRAIPCCQELLDHTHWTLTTPEASNSLSGSLRSDCRCLARMKTQASGRSTGTRNDSRALPIV